MAEQTPKPRKPAKSNPARDARIAATKATRAQAQADRKAAHQSPSLIAAQAAPPQLPAISDRIASEHVDCAILAIAGGASLNSCAQALKVHPMKLLRAIDRIAPDDYRDAKRVAAMQFDDDALKAIRGVPDDASPVVMSRAREDASHLRWRCAKISPKDYGDNKHVDIAVTAKPSVLDPAALTQDQRDQLKAMIAVAQQQRALSQDQSGSIIEHD